MTDGEEQRRRASGPDFPELFEKASGPCVVLSPALRIVAASDAYLRATMRTRDELIDAELFDVFTDDAAEPHAMSMRRLRESLERVLATREADTVPVQKYGIHVRDGARSPVEERRWTVVNTPLLGREGEVEYIVHSVADVSETDRVMAIAAQEDTRDELRARFTAIEAELRARASELEATLGREKELSRMLEHVARASLQITGATMDARLDEREALQRVVEFARELVGARFSAVGVGGDPTRPFNPWISDGADPATVASLGHAPRPVGVLGHVARTGEILRLRDVREHPSSIGVPQHHMPITSFLGVPLHAGATSIGNLYLANKVGADEFTAEDERAIVLLAAQTSVMLGNRRLYRALTEERGRLDLLARSGTTLTQSLDFDATLEKVASVCVPEIGDWSIAWVLADGEHPHLDARMSVRTEAIDAEVLERLSHAPPRLDLPSRVAAVVHEGATWAVEDTDEATLTELFGLSPEDARALAGKVSSFVVAPIAGPERAVGALVVTSHVPRRFGPKDIALVEELGRRAGMALINAELHEHARRAVRTRDEVLAVVSHDLRGPLSSIMLQARKLQLGLGPEQQRSIGAILRSARRIEGMIDDLLNAAAIEAGTLSITLAAEDPGALATEAVEAASLSARERGIDLHATIHPGLPRVVCDRARIVQVLSNLLGNALKFTQPGGKVRVTVARDDDRVRFSVSDTGPGIADADLPHLFERFWKGGATGNRGTGLGLSIAKGIVDAHGGRIGVDTALGRGSTFFFALRAAPS